MPAELMETWRKDNWKEGKGKNIPVSARAEKQIPQLMGQNALECTEECIQGRNSSLSIGSKLGTTPVPAFCWEGGIVS